MTFENYVVDMKTKVLSTLFFFVMENEILNEVLLEVKCVGRIAFELLEYVFFLLNDCMYIITFE